MGFQAYCRYYGILAPEDEDAIKRFEVKASELFTTRSNGGDRA